MHFVNRMEREAVEAMWSVLRAVRYRWAVTHLLKVIFRAIWRLSLVSFPEDRVQRLVPMVGRFEEAETSRDDQLHPLDRITGKGSVQEIVADVIANQRNCL